MKILVMGGTVFLGRHIVEAAIARGHDITLFNRGQSNASLFPNLKKLYGDRASSDLDSLNNSTWDAVIDTSAYYPRAVQDLLSKVKTKHYTFVSTISVYANNKEHNQDETAPVAHLEEATEAVTGETYGPLKSRCEQAAEEILPGQVLTVRSGLIVGPHDPTDRFTYWPVRVAQGGSMLAPGSADYEIQIIDARDEAEWVVHSAENQLTGVFNVTGHPLAFGTLFESIQQVTQINTQFVWISPEQCEAHDIVPWQDLPLWIPGDDYAGFHQYNIDKAVNAGLTFRPIKETIRATLEWYQARSDQTLKTGHSLEQSQKVLATLS